MFLVMYVVNICKSLTKGIIINMNYMDNRFLFVCVCELSELTTCVYNTNAVKEFALEIFVVLH